MIASILKLLSGAQYTYTCTYILFYASGNFSQPCLFNHNAVLYDTVWDIQESVATELMVK